VLQSWSGGFWSKQISLVPDRIRTPYHPARSLVAMPTELHRQSFIPIQFEVLCFYRYRSSFQISIEGSSPTDSCILHNFRRDYANQLVSFLFEGHACLSPCPCIAVACGCRTNTWFCFKLQLCRETNAALLCSQSIGETDAILRPSENCWWVLTSLYLSVSQLTHGLN